MEEIDLLNFIKKLKNNYYHIYKIIENLVFLTRTKICYPSPMFDFRVHKLIKDCSGKNDGLIYPFSFWHSSTEIILLEETIENLKELSIYGGKNLKYIIVSEKMDIFSVKWSRAVSEGNHKRIKIVHPKRELSIYEITKTQKKMNI